MCEGCSYCNDAEVWGDASNVQCKGVLVCGRSLTVESARAISVYVGGFLSVRVVEGQVDQEIAFARVVSRTRRPKGI